MNAALLKSQLKRNKDWQRRSSEEDVNREKERSSSRISPVSFNRDETCPAEKVELGLFCSFDHMDKITSKLYFFFSFNRIWEDGLF